MEDARTDSVPVESPEEIDRQLHQICGPEVGGVPPGKWGEVALLFAGMRKAFKARAKGKVLGFRGFEEWVGARHESLGLQRSDMYEWVRIGLHLVPQIGKDGLKNLGRMQIEEFARLAQAGKQISPDLLEWSSNVTYQVLRAKVDDLLGRKSLWLTDVKINTHQDVQAILLKLGDLLQYQTFTPASDRRKQSGAFPGWTLGDLATMKDLPAIGNEEMMKSARNIDVVWLDKNKKWPTHFFEVEHTTDVTKGLHRMLQLINWDAKFIIVGPPRAQSRFKRDIETEPFSRYKHKYSFRAYTDLRYLFRAASKYRKLSDLFLK